MACDMGDTDHGICHIDLMSNRNCFENRLVNSNLDGTVPSQAVCDKDRGTYNRLGESMLISRGQMGDGF